MSLWTIVHRKDRDPVVPIDCNPESKDEGMLAYRSYQAALASSKRQNRLYGLDTIPMRLEALEGQDAAHGD